MKVLTSAARGVIELPGGKVLRRGGSATVTDEVAETPGVRALVARGWLVEAGLVGVDSPGATPSKGRRPKSAGPSEDDDA